MGSLSLLAPAAVAILLGAWDVLTAEAAAEKARQRQRDGHDRFHREQDELRAYPWLREARGRRLRGAVLLLLGALMLALTFVG